MMTTCLRMTLRTLLGSDTGRGKEERVTITYLKVNHPVSFL
jgi:hypothetical protein